MSLKYTIKMRVAKTTVELVRRGMLLDPTLRFGNQFSLDQIATALDCDLASSVDDDVVYTPAVVLMAFLWQMLSTNEMRSCVAAVKQVAHYYAVTQQRIISTNTGAYCRARSQLSVDGIRKLNRHVPLGCEDQVPEEWLWKNRRVQIVDGAAVMMADTEANQVEYPQMSSQEPGLGFPIMRLVVLISLATGMVLDSAMGQWTGKETGETALFRQLLGTLREGEVVLADRYYCGWFMIALLRVLGVDVVARLQHLREIDDASIKHLGKADYLASWPKPQRPEWLDKETYQRLPNELRMRQVDVVVNIPGCRVELLTVATTLLDSEAYPAASIADLFRQRWHVELDIRSIKTEMEMDELRARTPEMVQREWRVGLLAYNAVRLKMLQVATANNTHPRLLSFTSAKQSIASDWFPVNSHPDDEPSLRALRMVELNQHRVGNRPDRVEPRQIKHRPSQFPLLKQPRRQAIAGLLKTTDPGPEKIVTP